MKIKSMLLMVLCAACFALNAHAQQQKHLSFTAAAVNVDGLPEKISVVSVNADGEFGPGATKTGTTIAESNWDIVALSEDFNFHSELTTPLTSLFHIGTHGGTVEGTSNETDGLGILVSNRVGSSLAGENRIAWNRNEGSIGDFISSLGKEDNGFDDLITKGFRYYTVTLGEGFTVDVYVLHMDAADRATGEDRAARTAQLQQLADYIAGTNNNRPILIIGDTNCRYTRDTVEEDLINRINNNGKNMTIKDAWIEIARGGAYPIYGSNALMVDGTESGDFKGEVVDKIFYINIKNAPLQIAVNNYKLIRPSSWGSDHPVATANFTLTNANGTATVDETKWTVDAPTAVEYEVQGCQAEADKTYYFMNVDSKMYIKVGGNYATQSVEGSAGTPITLEQSGSTYRFKTLGGYMYPNDGVHPYMDRGETTYEWVLTPVANKEYQYYITYKNIALASTGEAGNPIYCVTANNADDKQKWVLLDEARMKEEMQKAGSTFDCTPLLRAADFDNIDFNSNNWTGMSNGGVSDANASTYNFCGYYNDISELNITQTLSAMPVGNYTVTFEGFGGAKKTTVKEPVLGSTTTTNDDESLTTKVIFADSEVTLTNFSYQTIGIGYVGEAAKKLRDNDYLQTISNSLTSKGDLTLAIYKEKKTNPEPTTGWTGTTTTITYDTWIVLDNFKLLYTPTDAAPYDPTLEPRIKVAQKINETLEKVKLLNEAGQAAYDVTAVINMYENGKIQNEDDANHACELVDIAYANAVNAAHWEDVNNALNNADGDLSSLIINPSFETGDLTGWTYNKVGDTNVYPNSNGTYTTEGIDGTYLFNTYKENDASTNASYVKQTISGVKSGLYEVKAKLTSFEGRTTYLIGNSAHVGVKVSKDKTYFDEATLLFLVEDGEVTIGAIGGNGDGFAYYYPFDGGFFKADDFRLAYICDMAHGRLKLAIDKANAEAAKFDQYGKAAFNISSYETMYANKSLTGDGTAEAKAVYAALTAAAKAQKTANADMTYAIVDPSFERGDIASEWTTQIEEDTKVAMQDNDTYTAVGCEGTYLFNSWNLDAVANPVAPIMQEVTGLPKGKYRLTAMVTTSDSKNLHIAANNVLSSAVTTSDARHMTKASVEFDVTDNAGTAAISAFAATSDGTVDATNGGWWFKADDFHLTYLGREVTLEETATTSTVENGWYTKVTLNRSIPAGKWSTFVLPYTTAVPEELIAKKFDSDELDGDAVVLHFTDATTFETGVPYMVKPTGDAAVTIPDAENVDIDMTTPALDLTYSTIQGTYLYVNIPTDSYFISNNKYWHAADNTNKSKGYRAYIVLKNGSGAKGLRYSFGNDGDGTTGIDGAETEAAEVVAVFSIDGRRQNALQRGVNIVKMSDGTTKKVFVK